MKTIINNNNFLARKMSDIPDKLLDEFSRFKKSLKKNGFNLIISTYNDLSARNTVIDKIGEYQLSCIIDSSLKSMPHISDFDYQIQEAAKKYSVINVINLEIRDDDDFSIFLRELNFHRERIAQYAPVNIIFWILEYRIKEFITLAPDLWAWNSSVLDFTIKKEFSSLEPIPVNPEVSELNLLSIRERIANLIDRLGSLDPDTLSRADTSLLEELLKHKNNIDLYEKTYGFIDKQLYTFKEQIGDIIGRFLKPIDLSGNLTKVVNKNSQVCKEIITALSNTEFPKETLRIMQFFSILPDRVINNALLLDLFNVRKKNRSHFNKIIKELVDRSWLEKSKKGVFCLTEVRQCILSQAKPDFENIEDLLLNITKKTSYEHGKSYLEKVRWIDFALPLLNV